MDKQSINNRLTNLVKLRNELRDIIDIETKLIEEERKELRLDITKAKDIITEPQKEYKVNEQDKIDNSEKILKEYVALKEEKTDKAFFENIKPIIDKISESNGSKYYNMINKRIGIIADEFLMNSFNGAAEFIYITLDNYQEYINNIDILLVVSAWKGLKNEWKGMANPSSLRREKLYDMIEKFKGKRTKIVFYSKEDPVNYDRFIGIAQKCEYVFTTCKEITDRYKKDCPTSNVDVLTFSVNPLYHNPIGFRNQNKLNKVIFSGSWYNKYPHRIKDMNTIFEGVMASDKELKIIDRNYDLNLDAYFFPKQYLDCISPAITHEYLQKVHKMFNWAINFNSIKDSYTMFANRVYELQAIGNVLISNYSIGVNNSFPNVFIASDKEEVKNILNNTSDEELYELQINGIRRVMSTETSFDRVTEMLKKIGEDVKPTKRSVLVICNKLNNRIKEMFNKQSYKYKYLIDSKKVNVSIAKKYDFIAFFDSEKDYGMFYLEDMLNAFKYTNCDYITKDSYMDGNELKVGVEHDYVSVIKDKYRTVFWSKSFNVKKLVSLPKNCNIQNGYSIDHFEFNNSKICCEDEIKEYKFSVIIPTYNNGNHLWFKCFNSLKRSNMFNSMEIIIVDDGSTDENTLRIVQYLSEKYSNVKSYMFGDGGSGSASRPRNKGVELSTTNYITFLDPDNEAVNNGYTKLYNELNNNDYDLVIGNMLKLDNKAVMLNYYKIMMLYNNKNDVLINNKDEYLISTKFKGMSIQALMVRKNIIENNGLSQVIGAVGQDTLFFYELLLNSNKVKAINETIHIYYAAVEGSTVNNISKKYFDKALKIEQAKYDFFNKTNLLDNYLKNRYEFYFKNWYMKKLEKVSPEDENECREMVKGLFKIYEKDINNVDSEILEFINS